MPLSQNIVATQHANIVIAAQEETKEERK